MRWYGELAGARTRQILGDLLLVGWVWLWWRIATRFRDLVAALAEPGAKIESGGTRFATGLGDVADRVGDVPLAGEVLRAPFEALADAAGVIAAAGETQQQVVFDLASWSFWLLLVVPVLAIAVPYLSHRVSRARQASIAARLRETGDLQLLALRAAANRSLSTLVRASEAPGRDLLEGRPEALARIELRHLGLRTPTGSSAEA
ncbi:MAG: hypothetical protein R3343_11900 [Nitriliruptorales bacterium]|nr:hypothetical protein [Nitriliruptorales bacterium]